MNTVDIAATKMSCLPDNVTSQDLCWMYGGSMWSHKGDVYMLSVVGYNEFCMISLQGGNRFSTPKGAQEFVQYHKDFRRVEGSVTIHPKK
tara:strand:+ start:699 stop:968 length:270 start_codon:yes stop_codon:yes gene_type:complete